MKMRDMIGFHALTGTLERPRVFWKWSVTTGHSKVLICRARKHVMTLLNVQIPGQKSTVELSSTVLKVDAGFARTADFSTYRIADMFKVRRREHAVQAITATQNGLTFHKPSFR